MDEMKVEYVQPFLVAATSVLQSACGLQLTPGKPYVKNTAFESNDLVICIGVVGQLSGQVLIAFKNNVALNIASKMCMMEMTELNELSLSALSELGNMVLGNAATVLSTKNVLVDITTPTIIHGNFEINSIYAKNICMPLTFEGDKTIELDISVKET